MNKNETSMPDRTGGAVVNNSPATSVGGDAEYGYSDSSLLSIDFAAIWAAIYRSRYWIIGIVVGSLLIGAILTILSTPIYRAQATVQIDQEAAKVIGTEDTDTSAAIQDSDRFLKTQLDVIRSRSLAQAVAEDMKLFNSPQFLEAMNVNPEARPSISVSPQEAQRELVLDALRDNLGVALPLDSRIVTISFESPDPALAARVSSSFARNYIRKNLQRKFETSSYAREFLKQQLDEAAVRLAESEREALEYARRTRIIDASNAAGSTTGDQALGPKSLVTATLVRLNQDYAGALARRIDAQKKWESARGQNVMSLPEVLNNLAIQNLLQQKATAQAEYEQELQRRKAEFPTVKQAKARLDELDQQITAIAGSIRQTLRGSYETALQQERAFEAQMTELKGDTLDEQSESVQLGILQRKTTNNRQIYDLLLTRYSELNAGAGVQANNLAIVDQATTPSVPVKPSIPLNMALALLAGVGLAVRFWTRAIVQHRSDAR
jgi:uncharacterized protein involved in exopolysaccharide biosynthesis